MNKRGYLSDGVFFMVLMACVVIGIFIILSPFIINNFSYSEGEHTGYVTAVERYDTLFGFKGNLVYFKTDTQSTQEDTYCVLDEELYTKLKQKSESKELITIRFQNDKFTMSKVCNGGISIIRSIK